MSIEHGGKKEDGTPDKRVGTGGITSLLISSPTDAFLLLL
jgi:hypothetical protein